MNLRVTKQRFSYLLVTLFAEAHAFAFAFAITSQVCLEADSARLLVAALFVTVDDDAVGLPW